MGVYEIPERAVKEGLAYRDKMQISVEVLDEREVGFYKEMENKGMKSQYIILDTESFLQLNLSEEQLPDAKTIKEIVEKNEKRIQDIEKEQENEMDLTRGNVYDWLNWYPLEPEQTEEIIQALEDGLTTEEIKSFYNPEMSAKKMNQKRRLIMLGRKGDIQYG